MCLGWYVTNEMERERERAVSLYKEMGEISPDADAAAVLTCDMRKCYLNRIKWEHELT